MRLRHLWLTDFRNYAELDMAFADGLTAIIGDNGQGKTNLLEAIGYVATLDSFRGAPPEALVREGAPFAVVRAAAERDGRELLVEAEIRHGRSRVQLNRQPLRRSRDLLGALRVTVFAPDDLVVVKGGPAERRRFIDDVVVAEHPRLDATRGDLDRVLRQRNALLRQLAGTAVAQLRGDDLATLDVWDARLAHTGEAWAAARLAALERMEPVLQKAYDALAGTAAEVTVRYDAAWTANGLAAALAEGRRDDLRRGVSLVGPHRDDLVLRIGGRAARTHASQGEQRSLALALRLAAHRLVEDAAGSAPVLLLDDVFSELDPDRGRALLANLPAGQVLLTTAGDLPSGTHPDLVVHVSAGTLR